MNIGAYGEETEDRTAAILFYDGTCGFCNAIVRFVLDHERSRTLRYATLQGSAGAALLARHPHLQDIDSVVWLEPSSEQKREQVYVRSDAALRLAGYLGGFWRLGVLAYVIPRRVRDTVYNLTARNRHLLIRRPATCRVLDGEDRSRFLD